MATKILEIATTMKHYEKLTVCFPKRATDWGDELSLRSWKWWLEDWMSLRRAKRKHERSRVVSPIEASRIPHPTKTNNTSVWTLDSCPPTFMIPVVLEISWTIS
jgi:hypothetical protein